MDPITWSAAWAFAKKFAMPILLVIAALSAWHFQSRAEYWYDQQVECTKGRVADQKAFKAAVDEATKKNKTDVAAAEKKWQGVVADTKDEYDAKLNAAYAAVSDYAARLRRATGQAAGGNSGAGGISEAANPAQGVDGPGAGSLVPVPIGDLNVCAANTVKAQSWQKFWSGFVAGYPVAIKPSP